MNNKLKLYGIGDIKLVKYTNEMKKDFEKAYGVNFEEEFCKLEDLRRWDTEIQKYRRKGDLIGKEVKLQKEFLKKNKIKIIKWS